MSKFKTGILKRVACPRCGHEYGVALGADQRDRTDVFLCTQSENKNFVNKHGYIWCGADICYSIGRSYTYVGVADLREQPNRFRRLDVSVATQAKEQ